MSKSILNRMKGLADQAKKTHTALKDKQEQRRKSKQMKREDRIRVKTQELALKRKELKQKSEIKRLEADLKKIQEQENAERMAKARKAYNLVMYGSAKGRKKG